MFQSSFDDPPLSGRIFRANVSVFRADFVARGSVFLIYFLAGDCAMPFFAQQKEFHTH